MRRQAGPYPSPAFFKQIANDGVFPLVGEYSGELTDNVKNHALGAAQRGCRVAGVWMSVEQTGKDSSNPLHVTGEVYINGTTCLTTRPAIGHISGESSQQKTTRVLGDTAITQAVVDQDANTLTDGDVITYDLDLTRTASPTSEMRNVVLVVDLEPIVG